MEYDNFSQDFAERTIKNLIFIEEQVAERSNPNLYEVTQLINSLLGLVVFAYEKRIIKNNSKTTIDKFAQGIQFTDLRPSANQLPTPYTISDFIWKLRNAIAHCNINVGSPEGQIKTLVLKAKNRKKKVIWEIEIEISEIRKLALAIGDAIIKKSK